MTCNSEKLQQSLCFSMYQGFVFAYESLQASQVRVIFLFKNICLRVRDQVLIFVCR